MSRAVRPRTSFVAAAAAAATGWALALPPMAAAAPPVAAPIAPACGETPSQVGLVDAVGVHADAIRCLVNAGIATGTGANRFSPGMQLTRGQLASFLARQIDAANTLEAEGVDLAELPEFDGTGAFRDVLPSNAHFEAINRLQQAGIISGLTATTFGEAMPITRAQAASLVNRTQRFLTGEGFATTEDFFADDEGSVHEAAINAIASVGITTGTGAGFNPLGRLTREQVASFLARHLAVNVAAGALVPIPAPSAAENLFGLRNQHADLNAGLDSENVGSLQEAWRIPTQSPVSHAPLVEDGTAYFADWSGKAYAADVDTGQILWEKQVATPMTQWPWHGLAGTGELANGVYYVGSVEGKMFALDQTDGTVLWEADVAEDDQAGVLAPPQFYKGLLLVGLSSVEEPLDAMLEGFEPDFKGKVMALDASDGSLVWERQLIPADVDSAGVPVWSTFAVDRLTDTVFFTTGNNYIPPATDLSDAVIAVDAMTGDIKWAHQVYTQDIWTPEDPLGPDWDFGAGPQLFEAEVDGEMRALVGAANKSGTYFVFDRQTGDLVWSTVIGYGAVGGGMLWEASIGDGKVYTSSNNRFVHGGPGSPSDFPINVKKLDAATGEFDLGSGWSQPDVQPAIGASAGFLSSDVYLVGSLDGTVQAYDDADGSVVTSFQAPAGVASALVVDGETLLLGYGVPGAFSGVGTGHGVVAYRPMP